MNRSECTAPVNSALTMQAASLTAAISYHAEYLTPGATSTVRMTGSGSGTWARKRFSGNVETAPGTGSFFVAQQCCCKCRSAFIFGDRAYNTVPELAGLVDIPIDLHQSLQHLDENGDPDGDPETSSFARGIFLRLWTRADAPCRLPGGAQNNPRARLLVPLDVLGVDGDENAPDGDGITTTVSGTGGPIKDESGVDPVVGYYSIIFTTPDPCANFQALSATLTKTWVLEDVTAEATITVAFSMG